MARDFADKSAARQWVWERQRSSSSIHVCRLPGTISGPCSALLEPDTNSKDLPHGQARRRLRLRWDQRGILADPVSGIAVLEYGPTEILPPVGAASTRPARLCRPARQASCAHPRGKPGFLTYENGFGRETDSPLEGRGFEPLVPRQKGRRLSRPPRSTSGPFSSARKAIPAREAPAVRIPFPSPDTAVRYRRGDSRPF